MSILEDVTFTFWASSGDGAAAIRALSAHERLAVRNRALQAFGERVDVIHPASGDVIGQVRAKRRHRRRSIRAIHGIR